MPKIYLDSCVIVYLIQGLPEIQMPLLESLVYKKDPTREICISDLTRLECRVGPMQQNDDELLAQYDSFFSAPEIHMLPLDRQVFDRATSLRAASRLRTPDALHLAASIVWKCDEFWTNDKRLSPAALNHIRVVTDFISLAKTDLNSDSKTDNES
ncbi:MAG: PIN domain-containing protein [Candidatus Omnitrophota bacterium]|jgi:predicted nucleic acid-binding protein|nr:MAG: PIN domain-containing protein [Candidatus Omnitrophota bacterium]